MNKGAGRGTRPATKLGRDAMALGLETLDLARMHEKAFAALTPVDCSARLLAEMRKRSSGFFLEALTPFEENNRHLKLEIAQRKSAEAALLKSEQHHVLLLKQSRYMEERLRLLSRQLLLAQEEERKKISRELHDQVAQMLAGINVHLATLKTAASIDHVGLEQKINSTQRIVERTLRMVHRFARELRPPVLDDLGLIPAFESYLKTFTERTGVLVHLTVFAEVEQLSNDKRTMLYRVAQAALANVGQHAKASRVTLTLMKAENTVSMQLHDDGKSFDVERVLFLKRNLRLGLIGMRERAEMLGGTFNVESAVDKGTTVTVKVPFLSHGKSSRR